MKEMVCVEAFGADLLLAFETKQNVVLRMASTFVGETTADIDEFNPGDIPLHARVREENARI